MIEINLLPEGRKKKQERFRAIDFSGFKLQDTAILSIVGAVFGILFMVQITLVSASLFMKSGLASLGKQYETILPKKQEADSLRGEINLINRKVRAIDELMVNRFSWAKKLDGLNNSMIPGVWLSELSYDERAAAQPAVQKSGGADRTVSQKGVSRYLALAGYALNTREEGNATIGKFIKSLKNNPGFYSDFSDIQLAYTKVDKAQGQDVVVFRMTCLFKEKAK